MSLAILNYSTQISVDKTVAEISKALAQAKAQAVLTEYDEAGVLTAVSFRIMGAYGLMSFRLPANVERIFTVIKNNRKIPAKLRTREQACRVAWRIVKDWLEAQLAMTRAEMVTVEQVFLPYAQDSSGVTLYEALAARKFSGLTLPAPR